jgi:hypothetical protein
MTDLDKRIAEVLQAEDREILDRYGEEGVFAQVGGLFRGKLAWTSVVTVVAQMAMFAIAIYAGAKFLAATDGQLMARWAALAALAAAGTLIVKTWFWMQMQTNRVLREVKRLELQIARMEARGR